MVAGAWTGPALPPPQPIRSAPVLPTAGRFLTAPAESLGASLSERALKVMGLPYTMTNQQVAEAAAYYG
eukprot:8734559-Lingulodinium_polyedra.AAC.1